MVEKCYCDASESALGCWDANCKCPCHKGVIKITYKEKMTKEEMEEIRKSDIKLAEKSAKFFKMTLEKYKNFVSLNRKIKCCKICDKIHPKEEKWMCSHTCHTKPTDKDMKKLNKIFGLSDNSTPEEIERASKDFLGIKSEQDEKDLIEYTKKKYWCESCKKTHPKEPWMCDCECHNPPKKI